MNRDKALQQIEATQQWDILIIGGGATGLGIAVDAASRGYKTLLVEQYDFAKGTSSKATKLLHGGVRYLAQGNIKLVKEALSERSTILKNAAHVCSIQNFIIPCYSYWEKFKYGIGLKLYDLLAGKFSLGKTQWLNAATTKQLLSINDSKIKAGVLYKDGQFDDSRLAINLAQTATNYGASVVNYVSAIEINTHNNWAKYCVVKDVITAKVYTIHANVIVNATGVLVDNLLEKVNNNHKKIIAPSQGVHLVISHKYFTTSNALMLPKTKDGRVLFAVPWHNAVVVGTTDTPVSTTTIEPKALQEEIDFILDHFNIYTKQNITTKDVLTVFVGQRPLVKKQDEYNTSKLNREHFILQTLDNFYTITGGKWTTYRQMAEDLLSKLIQKKLLPNRSCITKELSIYGNDENPFNQFTYSNKEIEELQKNNAYYKNSLVDGLPYTIAHIIYSMKYEMALTVEDILARRTRILFLNAEAAITIAPLVAEVMAEYLQKNNAWKQEQINSFATLASTYFIIQ